MRRGLPRMRADQSRSASRQCVEVNARGPHGCGEGVELRCGNQVTHNERPGGIHGGNRLGGNAIVDFTVFGRIAGQSVVEGK